MIYSVYTFLQSQKSSLLPVGILNLYLTESSRTEFQNVSIKSINDTTTRREIHLRNKPLFLMETFSC